MTKTWIAAAALSLTALAGCGDDGGGKDNPDAAPGAADAAPVDDSTVKVAADITADTTWVASKTYVLPAFKPTFVKNGATLTIEPGTVIKGEQGSLLAIARGAKLKAEGTKDKVIVFTTSQPDDKKSRGFWGGVLVLGAAKINTNVLENPSSKEAVFEAFPPTQADGKFGGDKDDDDSGVLKYVRIEFAGYNFTTDREFNNLTLCGVGNKTVIDFVQVHGGADDGIELFGGTVNVKHIVSSQNQDDGFDTDNGWNGKAQFVIVQDVTPQAAAEASNGYESDNHAKATAYKAEPRTLPTLYNVTLIGKAEDTGAAGSFAGVFRRGTGGHYFNQIFLNFPKGPEFRDAATQEQLDAGDPKGSKPNLSIQNSIFFKKGVEETAYWPSPQPPVNGAAVDIDEKSYLLNTDPAKDWKNKFADPGLGDPTSLTAPNFKPAAKLTGGAVPTDPFFDTTVDFIGAIGTDDWTAGWVKFPQPAAFGG